MRTETLIHQLVDRDSWAILLNSSYLVGAAAVTAGLGFFYWWVAARNFSAQTVGIAAAAVSLMTLLGYFAMLGLGTMLIAEVNRRRNRVAAYMSTALLLPAAAGLALALVVETASPVISPELELLVGDGVGASLRNGWR